MKSILTIKGTHCHSCKALIEEVALENPAIHSCSVDYETGRTEIEHDENVDWDAFGKEIAELGEYAIAEKTTL